MPQPEALTRRPDPGIQIKLRLREPLHRRLMREAERHRFTLNNEIRLRLEDSFTREATRVLDDVAQDMALNWSRYGNRLLMLSLEDQLAAALARTTDPEVVALSRTWLLHRERDRRLGGVS